MTQCGLYDKRSACRLPNQKHQFSFLTVSIAIVFALIPATGWSCSVNGITSNIELVRTADAVVRVRAVEYATPPSNPRLWTTGVPDSKVRFEQLERIRGTGASNLALPGYLVQTDDFNDQKSPYTFVRPTGRAGSCFANSYRQGAEYLLFLKKTDNGGFTVNWAALAPVNEQLHSPEDAWLLWVRDQARSLTKESN